MQQRREQDERHLDQADQDVGHDLAGHHLDRQRRRGEQVLERAALALARHREAVISTIVIVRITPISPGTMLYAVMPSGL